MPRECLAIIESKSKVHYSCNKPVVAKDMVKALLFDKKSQNQAPTTVKAVEESFNYNQGNTIYRPPMMSNQIRPLGFPPVPNNQNVQLNQRNNQNRFNQNQNRGNNFNHGSVYQPPVFQPPAYQALYYQAPAPQTQGVLKEDFSAYVKANDAVMRNIVSTSSSGTLPSNTIANLRSDLKAITTRSGVSYDEPQIPPPPSFLPKVMENEPEATKEIVHPTNNESTEDVQPPVIQSKSLILTSEPVISPTNEPVISPVSALRPNQRPSIPYPSRMQDQKLRDKANDQREKFFQIFKDLNFNISFADALILMPKFGPSIKSLLTNNDKLCTFHFSADFVVVDFDADPRVPLILERSFLKIGRALIDVFEGELTLRVGKEAITFNLDQTSRYSANYSDMTAKRIDVIDMAFDQSYLNPEGDILILEAFLNDDPSLPLPNQGNYLPKFHKELKIREAKSDKSSIDEPPEVELKDLPPHLEYAFLEGDDKLPVIIMKDLSVEEKIALITVIKSHKRAITWKFSDIKVVENEDNELILTRLVTGWRVCIDYRKLNEATHKGNFPLPFMDQMLKRLAGNQYYCFLNGFSGYFQISIDLKDQEKTTFTYPYGTFAYRRMPFGLCNAPGTF
nr:DNA-directed DNA polymerase [Tanacetum cinerariifolium]